MNRQWTANGHTLAELGVDKKKAHIRKSPDSSQNPL
jgi:hypothetical protein